MKELLLDFNLLTPNVTANSYQDIAMMQLVSPSMPRECMHRGVLP